MGTRADFYIGISDPQWVGSIYKDGHPWNIPCKILVQNNAVLYEELIVDFLMSKHGIVESMGHPWGWPWEDSKMTDYSYYYSHRFRMVYAYTMRENMMFVPLQVMQGEDLNDAKVPVLPNFPRMGVGYGPNAAKTV